MKTIGISVAMLALSLAGCGDDGGTGGGGGDPLACGPGTVRMGSLCVAADPGGGDPGGGDPGGGDPGGGDPMMHSDGGPPPPEGDAGPDFSPYPPGGGPATGEPGCDETMGECTTWSADLVAALNASRPAGCGRMLEVEPRIAEVALRHATHQASLDRVTADSPDGNLFEQVTAAGVYFMDGAVLFASTRLGAADAIMRWSARPDTSTHLGRCDRWVGVGFATGASGASYVTVLFASP
jgi:hypothetical protein